MPVVAKASNNFISNNSLAPAISAISHFLMCNAKTAAFNATNEDEHTVSYTVFGPCKLNTLEICPEAIDATDPVALYAKLKLHRVLLVGLSPEEVEVPTKTPQFKPFVSFDV